MIRKRFGFVLLALSLGNIVGCKKEQPALPPPPPKRVSAPAPQQVPPGMEAENPAEKEGQP